MRALGFMLQPNLRSVDSCKSARVPHLNKQFKCAGSLSIFFSRLKTAVFGNARHR